MARTHKVRAFRGMKKIISNINNSLVHVAPSSIKGVGLFASTNIEKNKIILVINNSNYKWIKFKDLIDNGVNEDNLKIIKRFYYYNKEEIFIDPNIRQSFVWYINHSEDPNIFFDKGYYVTKHKILKGTEILLDYTHKGYHPEMRDFNNE